MTDKEIMYANPLEWKLMVAKNTGHTKVTYDELNELVETINRQQAEIERLKNCVKSEDEVMDIAKRTMEPLVKEITREQIDIAVKLAKTEAIKEFAERLKEKYPWKGDYLYSTRRTVENIDNLVKKMVGEQE